MLASSSKLWKQQPLSRFQPIDHQVVAISKRRTCFLNEKAAISGKKILGLAADLRNLP